jgi:hypothetical protein
MTEAEWLASDDPHEMIETGAHTKLSQRRQQLLAVALCWRIRGLLIDANTRRALAVVEAFADGTASEDEVRYAAENVVENWDEFEFSKAFDDAHRFAVEAVAAVCRCDQPIENAFYYARQAVELRDTANTVLPAFAELIRDVVGNPFRPVTCEPAWLTSDVVALARGIYDDKAFDRMPILADALQDAGCANEEVLSHCRGAGPHVRGCWVLDLLFGKQ